MVARKFFWGIFFGILGRYFVQHWFLKYCSGLDRLEPSQKNPTRSRHTELKTVRDLIRDLGLPRCAFYLLTNNSSTPPSAPSPPISPNAKGSFDFWRNNMQPQKQLRNYAWRYIAPRYIRAETAGSFVGPTGVFARVFTGCLKSRGSVRGRFLPYLTW